MTASIAVSREAKRRRVCPPARAPFEGETLEALLAHLEQAAPCGRVEALDALGAPVPRDSKETPLLVFSPAVAASFSASSLTAVAREEWRMADR